MEWTKLIVTSKDKPRLTSAGSKRFLEQKKRMNIPAASIMTTNKKAGIAVSLKVMPMTDTGISIRKKGKVDNPVNQIKKRRRSGVSWSKRSKKRATTSDSGIVNGKR